MRGGGKLGGGGDKDDDGCLLLGVIAVLDDFMFDSLFKIPFLFMQAIAVICSHLQSRISRAAILIRLLA